MSTSPSTKNTTLGLLPKIGLSRLENLRTYHLVSLSIKKSSEEKKIDSIFISNHHREFKVSFDQFQLLILIFVYLGTSIPAYYVVCRDDCDLTADSAQSLSFYLCHGYTRCNRTVSMPNCVMYAQLAAERARIWLTIAIDNFDASSQG